MRGLGIRSGRARRPPHRSGDRGADGRHRRTPARGDPGRRLNRPLTFALVGGGAIGTAILEALSGDATLRLGALVLRSVPSAAVRALAAGAPIVAEVPHDGIDLVVEAAGHAAIEAHVLPALARGVPSIVASVGALAAEGLHERLDAAARAGDTQLELIAGAIGAIDALAAARIGGLDVVRYTGRKPPLAWLGTPAAERFDLAALTAEASVFEGTARDAARLYPKNANVAATVAFAGLGLDRTQVRLVADPAVTQNNHHIEASGAFGSLELSMRNAPLAGNPKTSALTVYSAVRAIRQRVASIRV
ncbi:MAG: aspartate dehydrogenase [Comamonadaceae bacterium]|nr:MAG: aspartate dehydrogenase [Comamonadaceae bacterium]